MIARLIIITGIIYEKTVHFRGFLWFLAELDKSHPIISTKGSPKTLYTAASVMALFWPIKKKARHTIKGDSTVMSILMATDLSVNFIYR
jgi:hypothetical protein